jgi:hypothetical protein
MVIPAPQKLEISGVLAALVLITVQVVQELQAKALLVGPDILTQYLMV